MTVKMAIIITIIRIIRIIRITIKVIRRKKAESEANIN